jgi:hypothetical protein
LRRITSVVKSGTGRTLRSSLPTTLGRSCKGSCRQGSRLSLAPSGSKLRPGPVLCALANGGGSRRWWWRSKGACCCLGIAGALLAHGRALLLYHIL